MDPYYFQTCMFAGNDGFHKVQNVGHEASGQGGQDAVRRHCQAHGENKFFDNKQSHLTF